MPWWQGPTYHGIYIYIYIYIYFDYLYAQIAETVGFLSWKKNLQVERRQDLKSPVDTIRNQFAFSQPCSLTSCSSIWILSSRTHKSLHLLKNISTKVYRTYRILYSGKHPPKILWFLFNYLNSIGSRGTAVGIVATLRFGRSGIRTRVGVKDLSVVQNFHTGWGAHSASYSKWSGLPHPSVGKAAGEWWWPLTFI
jgi:hypothetical protein